MSTLNHSFYGMRCFVMFVTSVLFIPFKGKMAQILCMPANSAFEAT